MGETSGGFWQLSQKNFLIVVFLVLLFSLVFGADTNAVEKDLNIFDKGLKAVKLIDSCGTIYEDAILTQDLYADEDCITIDANDITLDCQGYKIIGHNQEGSGVKIFQKNNVKIQNCGIFNFRRGIDANYSTQIKVLNNTIKWHQWSPGEHIDAGIVFDNSNNCLIQNNTVTKNYGSIIVLNSEHFNISNNVVVNNKWGVFLLNSKQNVIENNIISINTGNCGIYLMTNSNENNVFNNSISLNWSGICVTRESEKNAITENQIFDNREYGLLFDDTSKNSVTGNRVYDNFYGIVLVKSENISLFDNELTNNLRDGLAFSDANNNFVKNLLIDGDITEHALHFTFNSRDNLLEIVQINATVYEIVSDRNSENTILDSDFDKEKITIVDEHSSLKVQWFLDVQAVRDLDGAPLENVSVRITDTNGQRVFDGETDENGFIPKQALTEYIQYEDRTDYFTPHSISATWHGTFQTAIIDVNESKSLVFSFRTMPYIENYQYNSYYLLDEPIEVWVEIRNPDQLNSFEDLNLAMEITDIEGNKYEVHKIIPLLEEGQVAYERLVWDHNLTQPQDLNAEIILKTAEEQMLDSVQLVLHVVRIPIIEAFAEQGPDLNVAGSNFWDWNGGGR